MSINLYKLQSNIQLFERRLTQFCRLLIKNNHAYCFGQILEREGIISTSSFYGQLSDYYSHVLALSTEQMSSSCSWCKSRELKVRGSPRFPCITPVKESFSSDLFQTIISHWAAGQHLGTCKTSTMDTLLRKIVNGLNTLTISGKQVHRRCSTDF